MSSLGIGIGIHLPVRSGVRGGISYDPDALAYIEAVESALGEGITEDQKNAINSFYVAEKTASRWNLMRRVYLPIWEDEEANSIDLKTLFAGSYPLGATHAPGYVQGNGATQYFDTGTDFVTEGLTSSNGSMFALIYEAPTASSVVMGVGSDSPMVTDFSIYIPETISVRYSSNSGRNDGTANPPEGLVSWSRQSGEDFIARRLTSGRTILSDETDADVGTIVGSNVLVMNRNASDVAGVSAPYVFGWSDAAFGAFGFGLGMTDAQDAGFTDSLKTLWETCTGLTLP